MSQKLTKVLTSIIILAAGYGLGFLHGHKNLEFEKGIVPKIVSTELSKPREVDFSIFWDAYNLVEDNHIDKLDPVEATYGAISGMIQSLKDPFSTFLDPNQAKTFTDDLKGQFDGIGAELAFRDNKLLVVSPLEGSPADKAGLKAQDEVIKIDRTDVNLLSFGESIAKIRGKKGTAVDLTVLRQGESEPLEISIIRDTISLESVKFEEQDEVGIIKISQFSEDAISKILGLKDKIQSKKAIVLDLRNNPGGLLQSSVDVVSLFDEKSPVVIEQAKDGFKKPFNTTRQAVFKDKPLAVLINGGSASASEIVAGALQDHGRAQIVGVKSFGKGTVQNLEELKDGSLVRITVASWLTPSGRKINSEGITPDIVIEDKDNNDGRDQQMERAVEILQKQ